jgi:predicted DNA-binding transcriptional regulator AlpA
MQQSAFTISEWCETKRISRSLFYILDRKGEAPRTFRVGKRQLISAESDAEWIREREAATAARKMQAA